LSAAAEVVPPLQVPAGGAAAVWERNQFRGLPRTLRSHRGCASRKTGRASWLPVAVIEVNCLRSRKIDPGG